MKDQAAPSFLRFLGAEVLWWIAWFVFSYVIGLDIGRQLESPFFWAAVAVFTAWAVVRWRRLSREHLEAVAAARGPGGHHDPESAGRGPSLGHSEPIRRGLIAFVIIGFAALIIANLAADPDIGKDRTVLLASEESEAGDEYWSSAAFEDGSYEYWSSTAAAFDVELLGLALYEWSLLVGIVFITIEIAVVMLRRRANRRLWFMDSLASLSTQIPFYVIEIFTVVAMIGAYFFIWDKVSLWHLPVNWWTILLGVLAADFAYYWEHRTSHEVRLLWTGHSVHHSSPILNTAVAFRFGPFEPVLAVVFHLPLVLLGFHPAIVIAGELAVQAYQFWIHTEVIGRLGPLDRFLNTRSNHRVHHGSDQKYLDRNHGGILVVWDHVFGTYQAEEERPTYGLTTQINTTNPIKVWFSEFPSLFADLKASRSWREWLGYLFNRPGWRPSGEVPLEAHAVGG